MSSILKGLKVVDAATYIAAPSAAAILGDFGADVIKVERPPHGDPYRHLFRTPAMPESDVNYPFIVDNRNKRSVALNLASTEGRGVFLKLAQWADVILTNYQPQMLRRFAISWEDLRPLNDRLIFASLTGYGEDGVEAEKPGYDMTAYFARSGLMSHIHNAGAEPATSPCGFGDHPTAISLLAGVLLALYQRDRTGKGSKVNTTLMANGAWSNASLIQAALCGARWPERWTRGAPPNPLINHYCSSDGKRFLFCLLDPAQDWRKLCGAIGRPELATDPRFDTLDSRRVNCQECVALLDTEFGRHPMSEWARRFQDYDVLYGPVPHTTEVASDPQMEVAGVFVPFADQDGLKTVASPIQVEGISKVPPHFPPEPGEHTREILTELGYSDSEISDLERAGAVSS
jgi:formyl-CoA transferase